jgi:ubiquinone/menaquinone biosynthesis C-methylase UbiE
MELFSYKGYEIPVHLVNITGGGPDTFDMVAQAHKSTLEESIGLNPSDSYLEIGCGIGRDAIFISELLNAEGRYVGVDIIGESIAWCANNISVRHPNCSFVHFNVKDQLHNPGGDAAMKDFKVPIEDGTVDKILVWSVFTHMEAHDIEHYLREFRRVLKVGGRGYATFFVINDDVLNSARQTNLTPFHLTFQHSLGPGCFINDADYPMGAVGYSEAKVLEMVQSAGLTLHRDLVRGSWSGYWPAPEGGQDAVVFTRA